MHVQSASRADTTCCALDHTSSVSCFLGKAEDMSIDHSPTVQTERNRIEHAGGNVGSDLRVNGGLNLSRAIGT